MDQQKKEINLTKEEIREMIRNLEPGTMITIEMPVLPVGRADISHPDQRTKEPSDHIKLDSYSDFLVKLRFC